MLKQWINGEPLVQATHGNSTGPSDAGSRYFIAEPGDFAYTGLRPLSVTTYFDLKAAAAYAPESFERLVGKLRADELQRLMQALMVYEVMRWAE
ncbi:MAG: hypothetical protein WEA09_07620 [Gemmatimonadota bacterium]